MGTSQAGSERETEKGLAPFFPLGSRPLNWTWATLKSPAVAGIHACETSWLQATVGSRSHGGLSSTLRTSWAVTGGMTRTRLGLVRSSPTQPLWLGQSKSEMHGFPFAWQTSTLGWRSEGIVTAPAHARALGIVATTSRTPTVMRNGIANERMNPSSMCVIDCV